MDTNFRVYFSLVFVVALYLHDIVAIQLEKLHDLANLGNLRSRGSQLLGHTTEV